MVDNKKKKIITRIAPSPTGLFHIGTARTALFNYLFARQHDGAMFLRIEDTDKERSKMEFEEDILEGLEWLDIEWEGDNPARQSERGETYKKHLEKLIENGSAYLSKEEKGERKEVIRFKNPNKDVSFNDLVRGEVKFNTEELGDFVIARSMDEPLYHFAVVVDDNDMGITHVIRGEDHISNTPRQILMLEALSFERPVYAHIPLILSTNRSKLSKRHGAVSISEFRERGYLPEAMVNYMALLGWHPEDDKEIFSMEELVETFRIEDVQKGGAIFDIEKLDWINKKYIQDLSDEDFIKRSNKYYDFGESPSSALVVLLRERISKFSDIETMKREGELDYYFERPEYEGKNLIWKNDTAIETKKYLNKAIDIIKGIPDTDFEKEIIKAGLWDYSGDVGRGSVLWPMRYAFSGRDKSPDPFTLAEILGKEESVSRLEIAVTKL